jgi:hypothetical protein
MTISPPPVPASRRPQRPRPKITDVRSRGTMTDAELSKVVLTQAVVLRGTCHVDQVVFKGPVRIEADHYTVSNSWFDGGFGKSPSSGDPENERGAYKALFIDGGVGVLDSVTGVNNDDFIQAGGGAEITIRHASLSLLKPFVRAHRDLFDLDGVRYLRVEDATLWGSANSILFSAPMNENEAPLELIEFDHVTFIHFREDDPNARPAHSIWLGHHVQNVRFLDCDFDPRPVRPVVRENANTNVEFVRTVFWETCGSKPVHKKGSKVAVSAP